MALPFRRAFLFLVAIRHTKIYVDQKLTSGTDGCSITSFEVPEGSHIIRSTAKNKADVQINSREGKVYTIPMIGVINSLSLMTEKKALPAIESERDRIHNLLTIIVVPPPKPKKINLTP